MNIEKYGVSELRRGATDKAKGGPVSIIQEWLCLQGLHVMIDGEFGPATEAAVRAFQRRTGLMVTGVLDAVTWDALHAPMRGALRLDEVPAGVHPVVFYAKKHLAARAREVGGENRGPWVRLYMGGHEGREWPWCAGFALYMLGEAGPRDRAVDNHLHRYTGMYGCDMIARRAMQSGDFMPHEEVGKNKKRLPMPGDLFLLRNAKNSHDWTHTGIVTEYGMGYIRTIEGNTNEGGSREGYAVCARVRGLQKQVIDFVRTSTLF